MSNRIVRMAIQILRSFLCIACICSTGVGFAQTPPWSAGAGATYQSPYAPSGYAQFQGPPPGYMPANYERPLPGSREAIANGMFLPISKYFQLMSEIRTGHSINISVGSLIVAGFAWKRCTGTWITRIVTHSGPTRSLTSMVIRLTRPSFSQCLTVMAHSLELASLQ